MNRKQLIDNVAIKTGLTSKIVTEVVNTTFQEISDALKSDTEPVAIHNFGTFELKHTSSRTGRNPQRPAEVIQIPAGRKAVFKAAATLKRAIKPQ